MTDIQKFEEVSRKAGDSTFMECSCGLKHKIPEQTKENKGTVYEFICSVPFYPSKGCGANIKILY